jgi:hypothetical protein
VSSSTHPFDWCVCEARGWLIIYAMHSCTAISNRRVCLGGGCVQRGLAEQHRNQAADLREQALKAEKRRADRVRKHQREQKTGKVSNSKKRSKATTHAGSTRNRARDVDLTRYAASHHHRDAPPVGMVSKAVTKVRRALQDANAAAVTEEKRFAVDQTAKALRKKELAAKTESRGRKAANLVRLDKVCGALLFRRAGGTGFPGPVPSGPRQVRNRRQEAC